MAAYHPAITDRLYDCLDLCALPSRESRTEWAVEGIAREMGGIDDLEND